MNVPATLSYQQAMMPVDPGAIAAAESVKARIQSAYVMAMQRPRSEEQSRARILQACKDPRFAKLAEYSKPVGGQKIVGPSVRLAELCVREWGNIMSDVQVVFEDDTVRRVKVTLLDLQTNASFSKEVQIKKTVERKNGQGREIVGERTNTYGDKVFIVLSTDDELHNKEAALISKIIRNEGLRLIPSDIVDEARAVAKKALHDRDAKDPAAAKKAVLDSFMTIGVQPKNLEAYMGHSLDTVSPAELQDLRAVYQAIQSGEATWADYTRQPAEDPKEPGPTIGANPTAQPQPATPETVPCPDRLHEETGEPMNVLATVCANCPKRDGCPAWAA